ncbi:hypothetical protein Slin15195_G033970 [Septoria linicola]|uniref:Uncharacterized protein n=1 Tax=Septoria linicola TaxID=215465 RepID=A0A9Q9AN94_9PEZI|nr:hypothetical protein Slin14017_G033000 [Septoria linicola]USW50078.1 hypothetical protein Slin15195_G033970 [Septoria linicola]
MDSDGMDIEESDPFNPSMKFVFGGDTNVFTKTPANVTKDYFEGPAPAKAQVRSGKGATRKRKAAAAAVTDPSTPPVSKRAKGKANIGTLSSRPKQTRTYKGKTAAARPIPRTYEECDEADKMLIEWRDQKKEWAPIKVEWKRLTGEGTAQSTLPNRYTRLKMNFAMLNEEDNAILLQAKREIEDSFQAQKWSLVATKLLANGGSDYTSCPIILQRQWKKLMLGGGAVMPAGMVDPDFEGSGDDVDED